MEPENLMQIISMGEGYQAEFKISVPSKPREIAEEVCAFANASGGTVILGVGDDFKSFSRNPLIFGLFNRMRLVEQIGSGIPRIRDMMKSSSLPEPVFRMEGMFTVVLKKPVNWAIVRRELIDVLSELQISILDLINSNREITIRELHEKIGVSTTSIENNLKTLKNKNILIRIGGLKTKTWAFKWDWEKSWEKN